MSKILTASQKTFVDIYDSYNLSVTPDVVSILCNKNGIVEYATSFRIEYVIKTGDVQIDSICSVDASSLPEGIIVDTSESGLVILTVEQGAFIDLKTNTTVKLTITTNNSAQIVFDHYVTIIGVQSSDTLCTFKIYSPEGSAFTENIETITLNTVLLDGQTEVEGSSYKWSYYSNVNKEWTDINESVIKQLSVAKRSEYSDSTIKCVVSYNDIEYTDYFTFQQQADKYDAVVRLLDYNDIYGKSDVVIVCIDLYKNNKIIEQAITDDIMDWYIGENEEKDGVIVTDIETHYLTSPFATDDKVYFFCLNDGVYNTVLGRKLSNSEDWKVIDANNQYVYINDAYSNVTSNIFAIPVNDISAHKDINIKVYKKIYSDGDGDAYNDTDSPLCIIHFSLESAVFTQNASQYFSFSSSSGLKIGQRDEKFYTQISSTDMGFYDNTGNSAKKVVSIGNKSATIKNLKVEEGAQFDCNTTFNEDVQFGNFVWQIETNGSLSLAIPTQDEE